MCLSHSAVICVRVYSEMLCCLKMKGSKWMKEKRRAVPCVFFRWKFVLRVWREEEFSAL